MQHRESVLRLQNYRPIPLRPGVREVPASMFPLASGRLSPHDFVTEGGQNGNKTLTLVDA